MSGNSQEVTEYSNGERSVCEYGRDGVLTKRTYTFPGGSRVVTEYHPNGKRAVESRFSASGALSSCNGFDSQGRHVFGADYFTDGSLKGILECIYASDEVGFDRRSYNEIGEAILWTRGEIRNGRKQVLECTELLNPEQKQRMRERYLARLMKEYPHLTEQLEALWRRAEEERARMAAIPRVDTPQARRGETNEPDFSERTR